MALERIRTLVTVGAEEYANLTDNEGNEENIHLETSVRTAGHVVGTEVATIWLDQDTENGISCTFGEQESATWSWWLHEPSDCMDTAKGILFSLKPATFEGLVWKDGTVTRAYEGKFRLDMTYANTSANETTVCRIGASTGGGTQHIKTGYSHIGSGYRGGAFSGSSNEFEGAINVGDDNEVQGLDIVARRMQWWVEAYVPPTNITFAYMNALALLTGTMNAAPFAGFAKGELLFLGANFSGQQFRYVPVTYEFLASPNVVGAKIGGIEAAGWTKVDASYDASSGVLPAGSVGDWLVVGTAGNGWTVGQIYQLSLDSPGGTFADENGKWTLRAEEPVPPTDVGLPTFNKYGHDYLWTSFEEKTGTNRLLTRPEGYHIERVYQFGDFSNLGINC